MPVLFTSKTSCIPFEKPTTAMRNEERKIINPKNFKCYVKS